MASGLARRQGAAGAFVAGGAFQIVMRLPGFGACIRYVPEARSGDSANQERPGKQPDLAWRRPAYAVRMDSALSPRAACAAASRAMGTR
jgi:hypothetical protein